MDYWYANCRIPKETLKDWNSVVNQLSKWSFQIRGIIIGRSQAVPLFQG